MPTSVPSVTSQRVTFNEAVVFHPTDAFVIGIIISVDLQQQGRPFSINDSLRRR